jgi:hypothetical protein
MATFAIWKLKACPDTGAAVRFWQCDETGRDAWRATWRQFRYMRRKHIACEITFAYRGPSHIAFRA